MAKALKKREEFDTALKDKARHLMILLGDSTSLAGALFEEASEAADDEFQNVVLLDSPDMLKEEELEKWFPVEDEDETREGYCVLSALSRKPRSSGPLAKLTTNDKPSEDKILSAFTGKMK